VRANTALALSVGDPSGVGPEIAAMAWQRREAMAVPPFFLLADPDLMRARASAAGTLQ
jgi:4-hydroxythreonine-4-phosphate dehydrogenase